MSCVGGLTSMYRTDSVMWRLRVCNLKLRRASKYLCGNKKGPVLSHASDGWKQRIYDSSLVSHTANLELQEGLRPPLFISWKEDRSALLEDVQTNDLFRLYALNIWAEVYLGNCKFGFSSSWPYVLWPLVTLWTHMRYQSFLAKAASREAILLQLAHLCPWVIGGSQHIPWEGHL